MMYLDKSHHFVRFCSKTKLDGGKVLAAAFKPRHMDTDGLSGDHYEHFTEDNYARLLAALTARFQNPPSKDGAFAKLNCGEVIEGLKEYRDMAFFKPDAAISHTLLRGFDADDDFASELIAALLVTFVKEIKLIGTI